MKSALRMIVLCVLLSACSGCALPAQPAATPSPVAPIPTLQPTLPAPVLPKGLWMAEGKTADFKRLITLTDKTFYLVESTGTNSREEFSEIVSVSPEQKRMELRIRWIRVNGKMGGFDSPRWTLTYTLEGDTLRLGMSHNPEEPYPTQMGPDVFTRQ